MSEEENGISEINSIKDFVKDGRIDDAVNIIAFYLADSTEENYIDRLENILETLLSLHGGRIVLRFLLENLIIDIPSLLENLSKKDSVLRYTFLLLLKTICENECDLFLPYSEDLLKSDDPNVREADLQLIIYMAGGDAKIDDESLISSIVEKLNDEKDFVVEKAIQALKTIGEKSPTIVTKILTDYVKETSEIPIHEEIKNSIDSILKSIVTVEKIEEIVEDEKSKLEVPSEEEPLEVHPIDDLEKEESKILDKELELKKKELEIKKKKLELEEKEKEIEEKAIQTKEEVLKLKEKMMIRESDEESEIKEKSIKVKIPKKLKKEESEILDKELELKKKDLEIKKKKLEIEEKEKELEEKEILEREKALKLKEELIEKEKELSQVEIELKQKTIEQKEQKIKEEEIKRVEEEIQKIQQKVEEDED
ncbi:MAG: HEAT repeat domain-containing protein [Candidatus Thorarchaeota archaeon]